MLFAWGSLIHATQLATQQRPSRPIMSTSRCGARLQSCSSPRTMNESVCTSVHRNLSRVMCNNNINLALLYCTAGAHHSEACRLPRLDARHQGP
jgi:hypothetical protein